MTVKQLIDYLSQFDPDANVWVIYDCFYLFPPKFEPYDPKKEGLVTKEQMDYIRPGDLIDWVG